MVDGATLSGGSSGTVVVVWMAVPAVLIVGSGEVTVGTSSRASVGTGVGIVPGALWTWIDGSVRGRLDGGSFRVVNSEIVVAMEVFGGGGISPRMSRCRGSCVNLGLAVGRVKLSCRRAIAIGTAGTADVVET